MKGLLLFFISMQLLQLFILTFCLHIVIKNNDKLKNIEDTIIWMNGVLSGLVTKFNERKL